MAVKKYKVVNYLVSEEAINKNIAQTVSIRGEYLILGLSEGINSRIYLKVLIPMHEFKVEEVTLYFITENKVIELDTDKTYEKVGELNVENGPNIIAFKVS